MHRKNFVVAVKVNGQILREQSDRVELPFGSEYSLLLKNLDSVRMQARISIDGTEATPWLIVEPGRDIEVERFVKDLTKGNRFKFIERTERIEQHRGIKLEDGLVQVEFKREKIYEVPKVVEHHTYHHYNHHYYDYRHPYYVHPFIRPTYYSGTLNSSINTVNVSGLAQTQQNYLSDQQSCQSGLQNQAMNLCRSAATADFNEAGITVPGSLSQQQFYQASGFETDRAEVLVLHLVGKKEGKSVQVAKTVKQKIACQTCGKKNKSDAKFCKECGTSLERI